MDANLHQLSQERAVQLNKEKAMCELQGHISFSDYHQTGRPFFTLRVILTLIFVLLSANAFAQQTPNFSKADALIRSQVASGTPSIAIAVARHGTIIWQEAVGLANREGHVPATIHTPYYLASVSKTITATALMKLVDDGKIDFDKPVNDYLGDAKLSSQMWNPSEATILRMATHTAGLTTYDRSCNVYSPNCSTDTNDLIRRYGVIVWQPGDHFDYSNADYGILGQVVAHSSGVDFGDLLNEQVFMPLGMQECFLDSNLQRMRTAAARYDSSRPNEQMSRERSTTPGASSMYCSVHDLALFGMFHLKDHIRGQRQVLSDHSIEEMQKALVSTGDGEQYGLGWWIEEHMNGYRGVLAQGGTSDATAYLQLIPSEDIAVAMLWNSGTPDGSKVIDEVLAAMLPRYREALMHVSSPSISSPPVPVKPTESLIGTWSGSIHTYKEDLPLVLSIDPSGGGSVKLGSEPEVHVAYFRFGRNMVKCEVHGPPRLGDTGPDPYGIDIKLYLHGASLIGAARTGTLPPSKDGTLLFYSTKLQKQIAAK
jgi:CubicO group peptidase (beta-lactamase class C family)